MSTGRKNIAVIVTMVVFRILTMLVAFKFLSSSFGTAGFGLLSQVMAVAALFSTFAGGGLSNGLVKEVAGASEPDDQALWLKAAFVISFGSACFLAAISVCLYALGSRAIFDGDTLAWVFILIGLAQTVTGFGNTAMSYLSGTNAISYLATASIAGNMFSVSAMIIGTRLFGFAGAVAGCSALAFAPSIFSLLILFWKRPGQLRATLRAKLDSRKVYRLLHYSFAMVIAASAVPFVLIFMRLRLSASDGWGAVGHWQAVARIGDAYIQVFGALFVSLLLPKLAALPARETYKAMTGLMPPILGLFLSGGLVFWIFSPLILSLAYSKVFVVSSVFVLPQLTGDLFKILASFLVYRFMALGRPNVQAAGEVVQGAIMLITFLCLLPILGELSAVWAYVAGASAALVLAVGLTCVNLRQYALTQGKGCD
jgi:O-antigen/teichoic acid export membrane protein